MWYFSSCKAVVDLWATASESFDAPHPHVNSCKYECFWPERGAGKGKGKGWRDPHLQAKPTHCTSWYWLPSWPTELFNLLESENSLENGLGRSIYFTWKATSHCQHSNVPSKLRGFGFNGIYLYISPQNVNLPSGILPLLHTWAYFAVLNLLKKNALELWNTGDMFARMVCAHCSSSKTWKAIKPIQLTR